MLDVDDGWTPALLLILLLTPSFCKRFTNNGLDMAILLPPPTTCDVEADDIEEACLFGYGGGCPTGVLGAIKC